MGRVLQQGKVVSKMFPFRSAQPAFLLATALMAVLALSLGRPAPASASCTGNDGSGQNAIDFAFSSTGSGIGGYSSNDLAVGQSQCWYDHGWSGGFAAISGGSTDLAAMRYFGGVNVPPHGFIHISVLNNPTAAKNELCSYYVPSGSATYSNPGGTPSSGSNTNGLGFGTGTNCFDLSPDPE